jgi:hypothetical protein
LSLEKISLLVAYTTNLVLPLFRERKTTYRIQKFSWPLDR